MVFFSGLVMLTRGIEEFQRENKVYGWLLIGLFLFSVYVSIQSFVWM
ncbi:YczI family protein [Lysinibacillus parviboronicapiens]|nr:YczI family protein [Lysinibacillus parviboronicapiens]